MATTATSRMTNLADDLQEIEDQDDEQHDDEHRDDVVASARELREIRRLLLAFGIALTLFGCSLARLYFGCVTRGRRTRSRVHTTDLVKQQRSGDQRADGSHAFPSRQRSTLPRKATIPPREVDICRELDRRTDLLRRDVDRRDRVTGVRAADQAATVLGPAEI